jgi:aspartate 1-decarboxylase
VNGAAARLTKVGNRIIVMSFVLATPQEAEGHRSRTVICDKKNRPLETIEQATQLTR